MSATAAGGTREKLQNQLKTKHICRFCLTQKVAKLESIYARDPYPKSTTPLPLQIMACVSIEVFSNDGMPSWVCGDCRRLFEHNYQFKQMCKRAETLLRQFPLTGVWPEPLDKPKLEKLFEALPTHHQQVKIKSQSVTKPVTATTATNTSTTNEYSKQGQQPFLKPSPSIIKTIDENKASLATVVPIKILNSNPAPSPEPPIPLRLKTENFDEQAIIILDNDELSMDDVQRLIAATDNEEEFIASKVVMMSPPTAKSKAKPKVLNKSSMRILNKEANVVVEPRLSRPKVERDEDGNVAIVTEILDPNSPYEAEPDPITTAEPVETNVFPCPHCERSFPLRQLRDIHMVNHNRERSFQCNECDKSFFSKYDLQKHSLTHTGDKPFKCSICDKGFTRSTLLHRHEKTHTDIPKFICVFCEKQFISKEEMEKHTERHRKNRPYQCKICSKAFAFKQGLERHEVVHSRDQPYPCQYCDLSFSTPSKLARHLTAHAGKRPYPCKFCAKSYLLSHHLTRHMRSHKEEGSTMVFVCSECNKAYKSRNELIYHSVVHAMESLICPLCNDVFENVDNVTAHIKQHAEGDAYACEFCDLIFMTAESLEQHTDADHIDDMAAYREDDKAQAENNVRQKTDQQQLEEEADNEMTTIADQTIDELFIDELPEGVQILTNQMIDFAAPDAKDIIIIKKESELEISQQQPEVSKQLIMSQADEFIMDENLVLDANNRIIAQNAAELDEESSSNSEDNAELNAAPAKLRKVVYTTKQQQQPQKQQKTQIVAKANESVLIKKSSPQLRHKVAKPSTMITAASAAKTAVAKKSPQIQIEKNELIVSPNSSIGEIVKQKPSINAVLSSLPKSVSVRRNTPAAIATPTIEKKLQSIKTEHNTTPKISPTILAKATTIAQRILRVTKNVGDATKVSPPTQKSAPATMKSFPQTIKAKTPTPQKQVAQGVNKISPVVNKISTAKSNIVANKLNTSNNSASGDEKAASVKIEDDKKIKLKRISVTKAQAAALKKEGRIKYKDGNMILTQNTPKSSK